MTGLADDPYEAIADVYDCEYTDVDDDLTFYRNLVREGPVLELGCGTGRIMQPLLEDGLEVWGIDRSETMLSQAKSRLGSDSNAHLVRAEGANFSLDVRFKAALLSSNFLWHFPDSASQLLVLETVGRHLAPESLLVVDLSNPLSLADRGAWGNTRVRFDGQFGAEWITVVSAAWDNEAEQSLRLSQTYTRVSEAGCVTTTRTQLSFHYIYARELDLLLRIAGYGIHQLYGSYDLAAYSTVSPNLLAVAFPA